MMHRFVTLVRPLVVLAVALHLVGGNRASAIEIWLSDVGTVDGSVTVSNMDVAVDRGALGQELYVWGRPDAGKTLQNISLNLLSSEP